MKKHAKTKILATLGPATESVESLGAIIDQGVDAVRLNFSHNDHSYYEGVFKTIDKVRKEKKLPITVLQDLQGPKIRVGELAEKEIELVSGETIEITTEKVLGTKDLISTSYKPLPEDANVGDRVLIDDGLLHLRVQEKRENSVICKIEEGGTLKPRKGMNLPGMRLSTPSVTEKDLADLEFALKHDIDYVALSFVRDSNDIIELRKWIKSKGYDIPIIAKIEKEEAVLNFEKILAHSDGIMVARGDLGVELNPQAVPIIQKNIIRRCNEVGKLVITATQMLESMINNPVPTRAEASDVANAVLDGTDVVMLSAETSVGKYTSETVNIMNDILERAEANIHMKKRIKYETPQSLNDNILDALGKGIAKMSDQVNVVSIIALTEFGNRARVISKFRPKVPVLAISSKFEVMNSINIHWGVKSIFYDYMGKEDDAIQTAINYLKEKNIAKDGDIVLVTMGRPYTKEMKETNLRFIVV
ncbi:MAG: pyruvate kinase [Rhodothermaceae bacterium]